jgi:hypothetical protein
VFFNKEFLSFSKDKEKIQFGFVWLCALLVCFRSLDDIYSILPHSLYTMMSIFLGVLGLFYFFNLTRKEFKENKLLVILYVIYLIYVVFVYIVSRQLPKEIFLYLKDTLFFMFSGFFLMVLKKDELMKVIALIEKLFLIQIPLLFIQYIYYVFIYKKDYSSTITVQDNVVGLLGFITGQIGLFSAILGIKYLESYIKTRTKKKLIIIICLFLIQFIVSAKAAMIIWVLGILYFTFRSKENIRRKITIVGLLLLTGLMIYWVANVNKTLSKQYFTLSKQYFTFSNEQLANFKSGGYYGRITRINGIIIVTKILPSDTKQFLLGNGVGVTRKMLSSVGSKYYATIKNPKLSGVFDNSYGPLFYEIGFIGVLLIIVILLVIAMRANNYLDRFVILVYIFSLFYHHTIHLSFYSLYTCLIVALVLKGNKQET